MTITIPIPIDGLIYASLGISGYVLAFYIHYKNKQTKSSNITAEQIELPKQTGGTMSNPDANWWVVEGNSCRVFRILNEEDQVVCQATYSEVIGSHYYKNTVKERMEQIVRNHNAKPEEKKCSCGFAVSGYNYAVLDSKITCMKCYSKNVTNPHYSADIDSGSHDEPETPYPCEGKWDGSTKKVWLTRDNDNHFDHNLYTWENNKPDWDDKKEEYVTDGVDIGYSTCISMRIIEKNMTKNRTKDFFADLNISTKKGSCNKISILTTMEDEDKNSHNSVKTVWLTRDRDGFGTQLYLWAEKPKWYDDKNNMHYDIRDYKNRCNQAISRIYIGEDEKGYSNKAVCQILENLNISTEKGSCNEITVETTIIPDKGT